MIKALLKITPFLFALWIYHSRVLAADNIKGVCLREFTIVNGKGVCVQAYPDDHHYSCDVDSCYEHKDKSDPNHHWIEMVNCTHNGSVDRTQTKQLCGQYQFGFKNHDGGAYSCTNLGGLHYTCPRAGNLLKKLTCSQCTR